MASWISAGTKVNDSYTTASGQQSTYGTRKPIIDPQFQTAYDTARGAISPTGANPSQQKAIDWFTENLATNPVRGATTEANRNLGLVQGGLNLVAKEYVPLLTQDARQVGDVPQAVAATSATPTPVTATLGSDYIKNYMSPYTKDVVDATLADLSHANDINANRLKMAAAAGGAFGGGRQGVTEAENTDNYLRTVASTAGNLRNLGFTQALAPASADASRVLGADQGNQQVALNNNQFNAATATDVSKFNAGNAADIAKFNVGAGYQGDQQKIQAADKLRETAGQIAGVSQQVLANVITANGVDMEAAQSLLAAGTITQDQLNQILAMAQNFNGYDFTQNTDSKSKSNTLNVDAKFGVGI